MSPLKLTALFVMVFCFTAAGLILAVKLLHAITKESSRNYWAAIVIFSTLVAGMVVYTNLGR